MKKLRSLFAFLLVCIMGLSAVACGNNDDETQVKYSETFTGSVSKQTYTSVEETVEGFLETELSGQATEAVFVGYEEKGELTAEEAVQELGLEASDAENVKSVQKIEVEYEEKDLKPVTSVASVAESAPVKVKRIVYVFVYENGELKYFVPVVKEGEALTASYFDSVFDPEKYLNCSMDMTMSMDMLIMGTTTKTVSKGTSKFVGNAMYMQTDTQMYMGNYGDGQSTVEFYFLDTSEGLRCAVKDKSGWEKVDTENEIYGSLVWEMEQYDTINEYMFSAFGNLDHTCFEKTATGYKLKEGKGWVLWRKSLEDMFESTDIGGAPAPDTSQMVDAMMRYISNFDVEYEIFIADGKMSKIDLKIDMTLDIEGYFQMTMKMDMVGSYYDFGTTKVDVPKEVQNLFN